MGGGGRDGGGGRGEDWNTGVYGSWVICAGKQVETKAETKSSHFCPFPLTLLFPSSAPASWSHLSSFTLAPSAPGSHSSIAPSANTSVSRSS